MPKVDWQPVTAAGTGEAVTLEMLEYAGVGIRIEDGYGYAPAWAIVLLRALAVNRVIRHERPAPGQPYERRVVALTSLHGASPLQAFERALADTALQTAIVTANALGGEPAVRQLLKAELYR